jgi:uncharacterized protein YbjT (DUF2867 family)
MATVWLAGGTGLVGGVLLRYLLEDGSFTKVVSTGRRTLPLRHAKLSQATVDFRNATTFEALDAPDVGFCCLGTTMKKAGSREAFRAVDHDAVLAFAEAAHRRGARTFVHVSALGADPRSRIFYNRVKGEIEEAVARIGFGSLFAFRPSILDGERRERRLGERIGLTVMRAIQPVLAKYRPTPVELLAHAMLDVAKGSAPGVHVVEADQIIRWGRSG